MDKTVELTDPFESGTSITDFKKSGGSLVPSSCKISLVGWMRLDSRYGMGDTDFSTMKRTNSQGMSWDYTGIFLQTFGPEVEDNVSHIMLLQLRNPTMRSLRHPRRKAFAARKGIKRALHR
jgi:hypothetical protein